MEISIRDGRPEDAHAVSRLARRAKSAWGYPSDWLEQWKPALTLSDEYLRAHPSFVAFDGPDPVGVCVLEVSGSEASLAHLWIAPEYQRRGIGRRLIDRALEVAARRGVNRVEVESDPFAESFYRRMGARRLGSVPAPMPGATDRTLPLLEFVVADSDHARRD